MEPRNKMIQMGAMEPYPDPSTFANGGNIVTGQEQMDVIGHDTGSRYATIGEPNALTGMPTRETLTVTPLEPSVPVQDASMAGGMAPVTTPTSFAMLVESLFPRSKKAGRRPPASPVGAYAGAA